MTESLSVGIDAHLSSDAEECEALERLPALTCEPHRLRRAASIDPGILLSTEHASEWPEIERRTRAVGLGDESGAMNMGDRRALYQLVRALGARSVLEIGTHIGASTSILALALSRAEPHQGQPPSRLVAVDILDVNDSQSGPWKLLNLSCSPRERLERLGCGDLVTFVTRPAVEFMAACEERFDLILLDGDHAAAAVYKEIPCALQLLQPHGLIVMHDYFPEARPLWRNKPAIPGPWRAVERLRRDGAELIACPLVALPWPTKLGSHATSLALLARM